MASSVDAMTHHPPAIGSGPVVPFTDAMVCVFLFKEGFGSRNRHEQLADTRNQANPAFRSACSVISSYFSNRSSLAGMAPASRGLGRSLSLLRSEQPARRLPAKRIP